LDLQSVLEDLSDQIFEPRRRSPYSRV